MRFLMVCVAAGLAGWYLDVRGFPLFWAAVCLFFFTLAVYVNFR